CAQQAHRFFYACLFHFMDKGWSYVAIPKALLRRVEDGLQQAFTVKQSGGRQAGGRQGETEALQGGGLDTHQPGHIDLVILHASSLDASSLAISLQRENG